MLKKLSTLYMSQLLKAILPLIFVPMTISILGVEEYGLVSFMTMLIGVLGVFDMGISGTFIKTVSVGKDNAVTYDKVISVFLKAICFFFLISLILSLVFFVFADNIYTSWLKTNVNYAEALVSIKLIGFILACTYFKSYISSFLQGMEKQVHLSLWGAVYSILFYAGAYYSIKYVESSLSFFFFILSLVVLVDIIVLSSILILIIHNHKKSISTVESMSVSSEDEMDLSVSGIIKLSLHLSGLSFVLIIFSDSPLVI